MHRRRVSRRRVLVGAGTASAVSLAALAGCLGDDVDGADETGADDAADGVDDETDTNPGDDSNDDAIEIETREGGDDEPNFVFDPLIAEVEPGETVRWTNTDGVFHTVTATDSLEERTPNDAFDEELAAEGDTVEWTPDEAGLHHYYCSPHAGFMIGTLAVGDVDEAALEAAEKTHEDPEGVADDDDEADDHESDDENQTDVDEAFVDLTGEAIVEIETREGGDDEPAFVFDPAFARVDQGATIEWRNTDGVFHTVTSTDDVDDRSGGGDEFDATIASDGESFEWTADDPGTQPYYCSPHAGFMYGTLEIE